MSMTEEKKVRKQLAYKAKRRIRRENHIAKDLRSPKHKQKRVPNKKKEKLRDILTKEEVDAIFAVERLGVVDES